LIQKLGFTFNVIPHTVFINPEFTLFQAPLDKPIILSTQINRFIQELNSNPSKLDKNMNILAEKLTSLHIHNSPYKQLPSYNYGQLKKGVTCASYSTLSVVR
jgi:hypothetical protein